MELKHLHTFLILSDIKNFTKTAEYLHYAQSSVTTQIQQLEEELNVRLFERIGKSVILTAEGLELIPYAQKMLSLSNDLKCKMTNKGSSRITIGASESICIYRLPSIIRAFQSEHPDVELYLNVLYTSDFMPLLANNTIDIAFVLDTPICHPAVKTEWQMEENICAFATSVHPLAEKKEVAINDFANVPLILTGKGCCYRKLFERDLSESLITPKIVLETNSLQVIKQMVLSELGICILPQLAVQKELDKKELIKINYETDYKIFSQLICHKDKWISPSLREFMDYVKKDAE